MSQGVIAAVSITVLVLQTAALPRAHDGAAVRADHFQAAYTKRRSLLFSCSNFIRSLARLGNGTPVPQSGNQRVERNVAAATPWKCVPEQQLFGITPPWSKQACSWDEPANPCRFEIRCDGLRTVQAAFMTTSLPIAGFAVIDAADLDAAIDLLSKSPCAVAHGVVDVWPLIES